MSFPTNPNVGNTYTNDRGITYQFNAKGAWEVISTNFGAVKYTISDVSPVNPALGDQWWDTNLDILKSWATDGDAFFWTAIGGTNDNVPIVDDNNEPANPEPGMQWYYDGNLYVWLVINGVGQWVPVTSTVDVAAAVPLSWYYSEEQFDFELFNNNLAYSWRAYTPVIVTQTDAGDDTIRVKNTNGITADEDYLIIDANGNTLALISILSVLNDKTFRTKTTIGFNLTEVDGAKISKTSFNVGVRGTAVVTNGDVLLSRPLSALRLREGFVYIRRTATGTGTFRVDYRVRGTSSWVEAPFLRTENVELKPNVRDDVFDIDETGILEFKITYSNADSGASDTLSHIVLATAKQNFENQRIYRPENITPANGAANITATPTLTLSEYVSLYNISQSGAEFRVGKDRNMDDLIFSTSSDFLSGWVTRAGETADFTTALLYDGLKGIAVGLAGKIRKTVDGGKTFTDGSTALSDDIFDVAFNGDGRMFFVGEAALAQYSDNYGTTLSSISIPGGYSSDLNGATALNSVVLFVGNAGKILRSSNGGTILTAMTQANSYAGNFKDVSMNATGHAVAVGSTGEIQTSSNFGVDWVKRNPPGGYTGTYNRVKITDTGLVIAVGTTGAIHKSTDYGATWSSHAPADSYAGTIYGLAIEGDYVIVSGETGMVQSSDNKGDNFYTRPLAGGVVTTVNAVAMNVQEHAAFVVGAGGKLQTALRLEGAVSSFTVPAGADLLQINNVYWWQGRYKDAVGLWSEWSIPTAFATSSNFSYVTQPVNTAPANNAENISITPLLQASAFNAVGSADTHQYSKWQVFDNALATSLVYDSGNVAAGTSHVIPNGNALDSNKQYWWKVRYIGTSGRESPWSALTTFLARAVPVTPYVTAPANSDELGLSFTIKTSAYASPALAVHTATQYQVSKAVDNFSSVVYNSGDSINLLAHTVPIGHLTYGEEYKIRVRHKDSFGQYSSWSPVVNIKTVNVPPVSEIYNVVDLVEGTTVGVQYSYNFGINFQEKGGMIWFSGTDWSYKNGFIDTKRTFAQGSLSSNANIRLRIDEKASYYETTVSDYYLQWTNNGFISEKTGQGHTTIQSYLGSLSPNNAIRGHAIRQAPYFFQMVSWEGTGNSGPRTIPHNLLTTPGMIMVISSYLDSDTYSGGTNRPLFMYNNVDWTKHSYLAVDRRSGNDLLPNAPLPQAPDAQNIYVPAIHNLASRKYIAYIFANDASPGAVIKCGKYTPAFGNAGTTRVEVGFKPQVVFLRKMRTDQPGVYKWYSGPDFYPITPATRIRIWGDGYADGIENPNDADVPRVIPDSTGFTVLNRGVADGNIHSLNDTNRDYFYMAIRGE